jgi:hypothetical protein
MQPAAQAQAARVRSFLLSASVFLKQPRQSKELGALGSAAYSRVDKINAELFGMEFL